MSLPETTVTPLSLKKAGRHVYRFARRTTLSSGGAVKKTLLIKWTPKDRCTTVTPLWPRTVGSSFNGATRKSVRSTNVNTTVTPLPPRKAGNHVYDFARKSFVSPDGTVSDTLLIKWTRIKNSAPTTALLGPFRNLTPQTDSSFKKNFVLTKEPVVTISSPVTEEQTTIRWHC